METNPLFKFEITKLSADEIKIDVYNQVDEDLYSHKHLCLAVTTIPEFIKRLSDKQAISEHEILPAINNASDTIEFEYSGSDREPLLTAISEHRSANGELDEGLIDIPLDFLGREEENMEYITPLLLELRKLM